MQISYSSTQYLPWGAAALEKLNASHCKDLNALGWLAPDAARNLKDLNLSSSTVRQVPAYCGNLESLNVGDCRNLQADWLHPSSCLRLRVLIARDECAMPDCLPSSVRVVRAAHVQL